jgi:predicted ribonuclease YlaK
MKLFQKINVSIGNIQEIINTFFVNEHKPLLIVPDTNALYLNTEFEKWGFEKIEKIEIVITPSVFKDLDKHKIEHRNESIRNKALKLINKFKEYRRRGKLIDGVYLIKDKVKLRAIATEPNFLNSLKYLDPQNDDDRLIAEILDLIKQNCERNVIMITADINLQNKCDLIDLPYIEPPILEPQWINK